eukprot:CAMPEP_0184689258 /NCGR_PEP_ID=MMETSP0312-20130426/30555_1 /TAXON_ID=31354 /ORGANISM="Compsopogon coeruleus, Strain SAG 36.94" /LENGTH=416 /DNA_ID=CAMNT_0027146589 /DNA_START=59 /DNA_END=1309 /DNA_ORIENTATION=-
MVVGFCGPVWNRSGLIGSGKGGQSWEVSVRGGMPFRVLPMGRGVRLGTGSVVRMSGIDDLLQLEPQGSQIYAEYIWLGGKAASPSAESDWPVCMDASDIRSKTKVLRAPPKSVADLPRWNYDGSSTGQAPGKDSEVILYPVAFYKDPFRGGDHILVLCDTYTPQGEPLPSNTRARAAKIFEQTKDLKPWFGIEQEYTMLTTDNWPLGWPAEGYPAPQGPYYCGAGATQAVGREIADAHANACLYAGLNLSGINAEVMKAQWEYQIGPCEGIESGDQIWVSRYIMQRIGEMAGVVCSFDPKPMPGDWNGAGCHTNYSTKPMREDGGYEVIKQAIEKLGEKHMEHIAVYGAGNERRLTGLHETAPITQFSWGVANRGCSIRVGRQVEIDGKGYFEDRRPASNMDPYVVTAKIAETTCL